MNNIHEELKKLSDEQMLNLLSNIGIFLTYEDSSSLYFPTSYRGGDSERKLQFYKDTRTFVDWTNGGVTSLVDIWSLANGRDIEEGFKDSVKEISQLIGVDHRKGVFQFTPVEEEEIVDTYEFELCPQDTIDDSCLNFYWDIPCQKWIDEGISAETQRHFGVKWDWTNMSAIIPVRNIEGGLIGVTQRSFDPDVVERGLKYFPATFKGKFMNYKTTDSFFGLENAEAIRKSRSVIIVEGEKSVMKGYEWWGDKSTVLAIKSMRKLSRWQVDMLYYLGVQKVTLCLDKDFLGTDKSEQAQRFFEKRRRIYEDTAEKFPLVYVREGCDCFVGEHENVFDHKLEVFEKGSKECRIVN